VREFQEKSESVGVGLGWHYLLDLVWAARLVAPHQGMWVLDAGAGVGLMQWWLADRGVNVLSVDRGSRQELALNLRTRHHVVGWRAGDLGPLPAPRLRDFLPPRSPFRWHRYPWKVRDSLALVRARRRGTPPFGTVYISHQNLTALQEVEDESMDAVVSISALEHNSLGDCVRCVAELLRVLRPGGKLIATVAASKDEDWFHEPSQGWCLTEQTLRSVFELPPDCRSNFQDYDGVLNALRNSRELRDNLAPIYFASGSNGMPWGVWDPKYVPVGVVRTK